MSLMQPEQWLGCAVLKTILTSLLILIPNSASAEVGELPIQLVLNVTSLSKTDHSLGQKYASCMSVPWLPTADQFGGKAKICVPSGKAHSSALKKVIRWVDHIAIEFSGQEIELQIHRR